jgi:hypothetical protein
MRKPEQLDAAQVIFLWAFLSSVVAWTVIACVT